MKSALLAFLFVATPSLAQERDYCPERPGLDTPACTMAAGRISIETSLIDWTRDDRPGTRTDTVLAGDTLVRVGVTDRLELRVGWTPFGHVRTVTGGDGVESADRVGDVSLGAKLNLRNPDGKHVSIAVLPFATLPVGRTPVGVGDWGAGLQLATTWDLNDTVTLEATPEIDATVDADGHGRHLAYAATAGMAFALDEDWSLTGEGQVRRDDDPAEGTTQTLAAVSLGWMARPDLQLDLFAAAGLNRDAPDVQVYAGISRRF